MSTRKEKRPVYKKDGSFSHFQNFDVKNEANNTGNQRIGRVSAAPPLANDSGVNSSVPPVPPVALSGSNGSRSSRDYAFTITPINNVKGGYLETGATDVEYRRIKQMSHRVARQRAFGNKVNF